MARGRGPRHDGRFTPFAAGLIALVVTVAFTFFAFSGANPLSRPYQVSAIFDQAANVKKRAAVRIAGIDVGQVTGVEALENGKVRVEMRIQEKGRPIHEDAEFKIRPRIFLEGNVFVDVQPGTPEAGELENDSVVPSQQTSGPVQFEQILTLLQTDVRADLKDLLKEFAVSWDKGGASAFNRSTRFWKPAYRYTALAAEASLGQEPHDLSKLVRGQAKFARALARDDEALKSLVTDFNTFAGALAREDDALEAAIPALRDVVVDGRPALAALNGTFPSLRAFARDALPGTRSSLPTINASLPFIRQARGLFSEAELRGLTADLRTAVPGLARLNAASVPLLNESRALGACTTNTLVPFAKKPIPDPDFPDNSGQPWYKQAQRAFVGLSGESRLNDANTPFFRVQQGGGPNHFVGRDEGGERFVSLGGNLTQTEGVRPARPANRPQFRPDHPCETQEPADMNAPGGPGDTTRRASATRMTPRLKRLHAEGVRELGRIQAHILRDRKGLPSVDPLSYDDVGERLQLKRLGLRWTKDNRLVKAGSR